MRENLLSSFCTIFIVSLSLLISTSISAQTLISIDHLQGSSGNLVRGMHTGEAGHTAVSGDYHTNFTAGEGSDESTVTTVGISSGYVANYNQNGVLRFLLGLESSKFGNVQTVYVDEINATYATGEYAGVMELNPLGESVEITSTGFSALVSSTDPFLAKYDSLGNLEWHLNPVESGDGYGFVIVPTSSESVVWAGHYNGYMQFEYNGETVFYPDPGNASDAFIFMVDSVGEITKHIQVAGDGVMILDKGCYDSDGNLYLTGFIQGSVDIETPDEVYTIDTETMNQKFFILKILPDWSIDWHVTATGISSYGRGVSVNSSGDLVFAGYYYSEETFSSSDGSDTITLIGQGERDIFMGKYSTNGDLLEIYSVSGPYDDFLSGMILDDDDNIYLSGSFKNTIDFDPSEDSSIVISGVWAPSLFVAKYSPDFNYGWAYHAGSGVSYGENTTGVGILDDGLMLAGDFNFIVDFNPNGNPVELTSTSATDGFLVKITNPEITTSIREIAYWHVDLYPNPAIDKITISVDQEFTADQIIIYDLMGKVVYRKKNQSFIPGQLYIVDLPRLSRGMYVLSLEGEVTYNRNFIVSDSY